VCEHCLCAAWQQLLQLSRHLLVILAAAVAAADVQQGVLRHASLHQVTGWTQAQGQQHSSTPGHLVNINMIGIYIYNNKNFVWYNFPVGINLVVYIATYIV
jgi:hypothetical protein